MIVLISDDPLTPIRIRIPHYVKTHLNFLVVMYPHFGTKPIYRWNMGDGHVPVMTKRYFYHAYKLAGIYNVTVIGTNNVSQEIGSSVITVQDEIRGLRLIKKNFTILPGSSVNISWELGAGNTLKSYTNSMCRL